MRALRITATPIRCVLWGKGGSGALLSFVLSALHPKVGPFLLSGFAGGPVETQGQIPPMSPKAGSKPSKQK